MSELSLYSLSKRCPTSLKDGYATFETNWKTFAKMIKKTFMIGLFLIFSLNFKQKREKNINSKPN